MHNPKKYVSDLTPSEKAVLSILIEFRKKNWLVYPSQETIAKKVGISRKTVSKSLFTLERLGLISSNYRHLRTSLYDIPSILWNTNIIRKLKKYLPALLLLLPFNVTQAKNINKINIYNKRSTFLYTNIWDSRRHWCQNGGRTSVMNEKSKKIREAIEKVELIMPLSLNRKAWLTIFPSSFVLEASESLRNLLKRGETPKNPFGYIYRTCMAMCKRENIQTSFKTRFALKKKYNFLEDEPPITPLDLLYKPEKETQTIYSRPKTGMYAIWNVQICNRLVYNRLVCKKEKTVTDYTVYNQESSKSLTELCDEWEQKWLKQKEKFGDRISSFDKGLVKIGLISMLSKHCSIQKDNNAQEAINYLKNIIFNVMAPSSITRGTILSNNEYYSILTDKLNKFEKELDNEGSNNARLVCNDTWKSYTSKKTSFMQKKGLRFAGEYKERYILDD